MAALFIGVMGSMGITTPGSAFRYAWFSILQLLLGELLAFVVNYVSGAERTVSLQIQGESLLPLRISWINTSAMLATGQLATMFATLFLELPVTPTMISAMIIGITPGDALAQWKKAWQRALGAVLGGGFALVVIVLLAHKPSLLLLIVLVFFGMFLASYLTKVSQANAYAYLQMGMVVPMVLIDAQGDIGSISKAVDRLVGVAVGLFVAGLVNLTWPHAAIPVPPYARPGPVLPEPARS
jgi:hypothetical protein